MQKTLRITRIPQEDALTRCSLPAAIRLPHRHRSTKPLSPSIWMVLHPGPFLFYQFIVNSVPRSAPRRSAIVTEPARLIGWQSSAFDSDDIGYQWCSRAHRATLYMCLVQIRYCTSIFEPKSDSRSGKMMGYTVGLQAIKKIARGKFISWPGGALYVLDVFFIYRFEHFLFI